MSGNGGILSLGSDAEWSKMDFAERDKCRPVLPRLSLARNLEKLVISLYIWDRMEGAQLPPPTDAVAHGGIISSVYQNENLLCGNGAW
jgi:hypothetical protein